MRRTKTKKKKRRKEVYVEGKTINRHQDRDNYEDEHLESVRYGGRCFKRLWYLRKKSHRSKIIKGEIEIRKQGRC